MRQQTLLIDESTVLLIKGKYMAKCPNCGREVSKPEKVLRNCMFAVEGYMCPDCQTCFKVTY